MSFNCGHVCCDIRTNCHHSHTSEPADCLLCIFEQHGQPWMFVEDPTAPCIHCVQWRCVDVELDRWEPNTPRGQIVPRVYNGVCDPCQLDLDHRELLNDRT